MLCLAASGGLDSNVEGQGGKSIPRVYRSIRLRGDEHGQDRGRAMRRAGSFVGGVRRLEQRHLRGGDRERSRHPHLRPAHPTGFARCADYTDFYSRQSTAAGNAVTGVSYVHSRLTADTAGLIHTTNVDFNPRALVVSVGYSF